MRAYSIGRLPWTLDAPDERMLARSFRELEEFRDGNPGEAVFKTRLIPAKLPPFPEPEAALDGMLFSGTRGETVTARQQNGRTGCVIHLQRKSAVVFYPPDEEQCDIKRLLSITYSSFLAGNGGFFMHGPVLAHHGQGVVFTAPSGGGKSTQADYWVDCFGDKLLNGDKALVRLIGGEPFAFGSPWGGSGYIYKNEGVPLRAVVLIRKAEENRIEHVKDPARILSVLAPNVYYPYWSEALVDRTADTMDEMTEKISFWILHCRKEKESALLAEQAIFAEEQDVG